MLVDGRTCTPATAAAGAAVGAEGATVGADGATVGVTVATGAAVGATAAEGATVNGERVGGISTGGMTTDSGVQLEVALDGDAVRDRDRGQCEDRSNERRTRSQSRRARDLPEDVAWAPAVDEANGARRCRDEVGLRLEDPDGIRIVLAVEREGASQIERGVAGVVYPAHEGQPAEGGVGRRQQPTRSIQLCDGQVGFGLKRDGVAGVNGPADYAGRESVTDVAGWMPTSLSMVVAPVLVTAGVPSRTE